MFYFYSFNISTYASLIDYGVNVGSLDEWLSVLRYILCNKLAKYYRIFYIYSNSIFFLFLS